MDFSNGKQKEKKENKQCIHTRSSRWSLLKLWKQRPSLKFDPRTRLTWMGIRRTPGSCWTLHQGSPWEGNHKVQDVAAWDTQGKNHFTCSTIFNYALITARPRTSCSHSAQDRVKAKASDRSKFTQGPVWEPTSTSLNCYHRCPFFL